MMKTDLDHLPCRKQHELARIVDILHAEFSDTLVLKTKDWMRKGRILKIILFGSYARGDWVDEPHTAKGYQSDFDVLIIVNHDRLTDVAEFWYKAEDRIMLESAIKTPVNFIVHTMPEVNNALGEGQYFFFDIMGEGIELYNLKGSKRFVEPQSPTAKIVYETAKRHYDHWFNSAKPFFKGHAYALSDGDLTKSVFDLHQMVERLYSCVLLVLTNYNPNSHNIKFLRSLCESTDLRLIEAWPRELKRDRAKFELLKRAYVEARYSEHYTITHEELTWLAGCAEHLRDVVEIVCQERLGVLKN